jgi:hypothetical protein
MRAKNILPEHNEEVLVRCRGMVDLALFNLDRKVFILRNGNEYGMEEDVWWTALLRSDERSS